MKKVTGILKSLTLVVWMIVLVVSITFLSQGFSGKTPLLMASETKQQKEGESESVGVFVGNNKKSKDSSESDAKKRSETNGKSKGKNSADSKDDSKEKVLEKDKKASKKQEEQRYAYLTFDDGPSDNTDKILDILKEKNVKATFFVVGKTDEKSKKRYQRIIEEGHSLGMHSYTHDYSYIYSSLDHYKEDLMKLQDYLYEVTGERVTLYRFPGGSSNSVSKIPIQSCINYLDKKGIIYYDWNASSEDAVSIGATCEKLNENILKDALLYHNTVILMHDLHECTATVKGLKPLIDKLQKEGYTLEGITQETVPVQHVKDKSKESAKK